MAQLRMTWSSFFTAQGKSWKKWAQTILHKLQTGAALTPEELVGKTCTDVANPLQPQMPCGKQGLEFLRAATKFKSVPRCRKYAQNGNHECSFSYPTSRQQEFGATFEVLHVWKMKKIYTLLVLLVIHFQVTTKRKLNVCVCLHTWLKIGSSKHIV